MRAENHSLNSDYVAYVPAFERGVIFVAQLVAPDVKLNAALPVKYVTKASLAHNAHGYYSACKADNGVFQPFKIVFYVGGIVRFGKFCDFKGIFSFGNKSRQLFAAYSHNLV